MLTRCITMLGLLLVFLLLAGCGGDSVGSTDQPPLPTSKVGLALRIWPAPVSPESAIIPTGEIQGIPVSTQFDVVAIDPATNKPVKAMVTDVKFSQSTDGGVTYTQFEIFNWTDPNTGSGSFYREDQAFTDPQTVFKVSANVAVGDAEPTALEHKFTVK